MMARERSVVNDDSPGPELTYSDGIHRAARELDSFARSHAALRQGRGRPDDVIAFADWLHALAHQIQNEETE